MVERIWGPGEQPYIQQIVKVRLSFGFSVVKEGEELRIRSEPAAMVMQDPQMEDLKGPPDVRTRLEYALEHLPNVVLEKFCELFNDEGYLLTMQGTSKQKSKNRKEAATYFANKAKKESRARVNAKRGKPVEMDLSDPKNRNEFLQAVEMVIQNRRSKKLPESKVEIAKDYLGNYDSAARTLDTMLGRVGAVLEKKGKEYHLNVDPLLGLEPD